MPSNGRLLSLAELLSNQAIVLSFQVKRENVKSQLSSAICDNSLIMDMMTDVDSKLRQFKSDKLKT